MSQDKSRRTLSVQNALPATGKTKKPIRSSGLNRERVHQAAETAKVIRSNQKDDRRAPRVMDVNEPHRAMRSSGPHSLPRTAPDGTRIDRPRHESFGSQGGRPPRDQDRGRQGGFPARGGSRDAGRDDTRGGSRDGGFGARRAPTEGGFNRGDRGTYAAHQRPQEGSYQAPNRDNGGRAQRDRNASTPRPWGDDNANPAPRFGRDDGGFGGRNAGGRDAGRDNNRGGNFDRSHRDEPSFARPQNRRPFEADANTQFENRPAPRRWDNDAQQNRGDAPRRDARPPRDFGDNCAPRGRYGDAPPRPEGTPPQRLGHRFDPRGDADNRRPARFGQGGDNNSAPPARTGQRFDPRGDSRAPFDRNADRNDAPRRPFDENRNAGRFADRNEGRPPRRDEEAPRGGRFDPRGNAPTPTRPADRDNRYGATARTQATNSGERPPRLGHRFDPRGDAPQRAADRPSPASRAPRSPRYELEAEDYDVLPSVAREVIQQEEEKAAAPKYHNPNRSNPSGNEEGTMRLSKRMSELGLCSRREADEWIEQGWVKVDGKKITELGSRVQPNADIEISPAAQQQQAQRVTILLHKPVGYVSGQAEDGYEPAVMLINADSQWEDDHTRAQGKVNFTTAHLRHLAPAGRLDIDSTGLLVLTQDGRIAKQLIGEDSPIEKEYLVRVAYPTEQGVMEVDIADIFPEEKMELLRHGLELDGEALKPAKVSWQNGEQLRVVLREGKKRQIRRMCELVGLHVVGLKRVRMGRIPLGHLPVGQWRYLRWDEKF